MEPDVYQPKCSSHLPDVPQPELMLTTTRGRATVAGLDSSQEYALQVLVLNGTTEKLLAKRRFTSKKQGRGGRQAQREQRSCWDQGRWRQVRKENIQLWGRTSGSPGREVPLSDCPFRIKRLEKHNTTQLWHLKWRRIDCEDKKKKNITCNPWNVFLLS